MPYTPHATWVAGDTPAAADLNNWETGLEAAHEMCDLAGLGAGKMAQTSGGPNLLMQLWRKASAFTFGTAPQTSDGYLRTPAGGPWGADSILGRPFDREPGYTSVVTGTTANTLVLNRLFILPAFASSITVSRVDVQANFGIAAGSAAYTATLDKVAIQVVRIAADGTETNIGSETTNTTTESETNAAMRIAQRYLSSPSLSQAIATTERLGFRLKLYAHTDNAGGSVEATVCIDLATHYDIVSSGTLYRQLASTPVALWFT